MGKLVGDCELVGLGVTSPTDGAVVVSVGEEVGTGVGGLVGSGIGIEVGANVGDGVGTGVGSADGLDVGLSEGHSPQTPSASASCTASTGIQTSVAFVEVTRHISTPTLPPLSQGIVGSQLSS